MKKKIIIPIVIIVGVALILFLPIPRGTLKDGGTREYASLTYKIVVWNKLMPIVDENGNNVPDNRYRKTSIFWYPDSLKSIDELWEMEFSEQKIENDLQNNNHIEYPYKVWDFSDPYNLCFSATVPELNNALVEYKEDSKIYLNGEYLLGGPANGCTSFYLADVTEDGKPELCFCMNMGSGMIDFRIEIYDYETKEFIFSLSDRSVHDYSLFVQDGKLCVAEREYMSLDVSRTGTFTYNGTEVSVIWNDSETEAKD